MNKFYKLIVGFFIVLLFIIPMNGYSQTLMPYGSIICSGGQKLLALYGSNGDTINWETASSFSGPWSNITGVDSSLLTPPSTTSRYYRAGVTTMGVTNYSNVVVVEVAYTPVITFTNYTATSVTVNWTPVGGGSYSVTCSGAGNITYTNVTPPLNLNGLYNTCLALTVTVTLTNPAACAGVQQGVATIGTTVITALSATDIDATCGSTDGSIDLTATSSFPPLTYSWNNGDTTEDINNLAAGTYYVIVHDSIGCGAVLYDTIVNSNGPAISFNSINSTCSNGSIDATVTGGTPPYTYTWNTGDTIEDLNNLSPGYYHLTVTDFNNCQGNGTVFISNVAFSYFINMNAVTPNCSANGALTANVTGGVQPYTYLWGNGQTDQTINGLITGNYSITVTDAGGCQTFVNNYPLVSSCVNVLTGSVYNDANGNCVFDAGDTPDDFVIIEANNGSQSFYGTPDVYGNYSIDINASGTYQVEAYDWWGGFGYCPSTSNCGTITVTFPSLGDTSNGNNFGFIGGTDYDLAIYPYCMPGNPGFEKTYSIWAMDNSFFNPYNGTITITFNYDPNLIYDSSSAPVPVNDSVNHTLTWQTNSSTLWSFYPTTYFYVPANLSLTYLLQSDFNIMPTAGDCDTTNNHLHFSEVVTSSLDPNVKTVTPAGNITADDSVLTYTIHCQNTGTDTTHFVIVKDTLSQYLDPATVVNLASSAPYSDFNISGTGILTWVFNPMFLPDSATNEAASKGFVMLKIKTKHNLQPGTIINNTASIYFDYNAPVVTNTVSNSIINGINQLAVDSWQFTVYPNPATDDVTVSSNQIINEITVTDVLGRELLHTTINQHPDSHRDKIINLKSFPNGVYFISIRNGEGNVVRRVVKE